MKILFLLCTFAVAMANFDVTLQKSNDAFSSAMLSNIAKTNKDESLIISGFSVLPLLAQLGLASVGETRNEILNAIQMPDEQSIKASFSSLNDKLRSVKGVDLKMANRIYVAKDASVNHNFAVQSRDIFNSDVLNVDFDESEKVADEINTWVEKNTNNKIKDLVREEDLDSLTRAVLVNAIYFKGLWKNPFQHGTIEGDFHLSKDNTVKVEYMSKTAEFRYGESEELDAKLVELPYEGDEASFLIVLPNKVDGLQDLIKKLEDPTLLKKSVGQMSTSEVALTMPKFKIETTTDLKDILEKMNIRDLFSPGKARLDNLLNKESDLYVSKAIQKAFIEVNEEGAEAAAANEFGLSYLSASIPQWQCNVDHPFVFYLKEGENVLFNGVYQA